MPTAENITFQSRTTRGLLPANSIRRVFSAYDVLLDGKKIGRVYSTENSSRSGATWNASRGFDWKRTATTRRDATAALVAHYRATVKG